MLIIYNLFVCFFLFFIRVSAVVNIKARLWLKGRKKIFRLLAKKISHEKPIVWFHCASLGEFEQGRPVIESFRKHFPGYQILLTFFSPSGYEIRKNYEGADYVFYLPIDTAVNARKFIRIVKPSMAIFIKYEYWFNYLHDLAKNQIPVIIISAIFRKEQRFFRWWGKWQLDRLKGITHFFVQNTFSADLLLNSGIRQVTVSGDTRFDRVCAVANQKRQFPVVEEFKGKSKLFVAGSTWPADEELLYELIQKLSGTVKFVIAPHEVDSKRILSLFNRFHETACLYSQTSDLQLSRYQILLIDNIGILAHIYRYADMAYIGGGFGAGIHNILEAAAFGKPVIFGPNHVKFQEAVDLTELGGAFCVTESRSLLSVSNKLLSDEAFYKDSSLAAQKYVNDRRGATGLIMKYITNKLPEAKMIR